MKDQQTVTGLMVRSLRTVVVLALCMFAFAVCAMAQAPAANTKIGNQASATYTDASNVTRTATSNAVYTTVQQVYSLQLDASSTKKGAPGTQVSYPHTLTNTGNGTDTFLLTLGAPTGQLQTPHIYADNNGDGIPDNNTDLAGTSVSVGAGAANAYKFVVVATVASAATAGQAGTVVVTAKSNGDVTKTAPNTDTLSVTGNAVLAVSKSMSANSGLPGTSVTVTLTYTNNGNATATAATFADALPAGMTYTATTGRWSGTGATTLTDATGDVQGTGTTIDYSVTGQNVTAIVNSIAPGVSGTITFQATVSGAPTTISNTAQFGYVDGGGNTISGVNTNTVPFTILQSGNVTLTDGGSPATHTVTVAAAPQGASVNFVNVVTNTGTGIDTFNLSVANAGVNGFPAGTTFTLYKSDASGNPVAPLIDTNGDGTPDSGPMAAGATLKIVVQAALPAGSNGGGPYNATATATSVFDNTKVDSVTEKLTTITANSVDLTNTVRTPGSGGYGAGPEGSAVVNTTTNPGTTVTFKVYVNNTSAASVADSFDLSTTGALPSGWSLTFRASSNGTDCVAPGSAITNSGVVNGNSAKLVCAIVSVAASQGPGQVDLNFKALSPTSGANDTIHDAVTVNTVHNVTLTPNNSGQIFPNGSVVYKHVVSNTGNVSEDVTFVGSFVSDSLGAGWTSILYRDNGATPGSLDAGDTAVSNSTTITLAAGASVTLFVKVSAPAGAAAGAIDSTTTIATYASTTTQAQDNSTVIAGDLRLQKDQALDANCDGVADGAFSQADIAAAKPGACVIYRITATNQGSADVTSVKISDATPAYTAYIAPGTAAASATVNGTAAGTVTAPTAGQAGTVAVDLGSTALTPGQAIVLTFVVQISQ
jgi:trimeric autotransporter adhesin